MLRTPEARAKDAANDDAAFELLDVPAAVVCANCGDPGCAGCLDEDNLASAVIAIVPWERPGQRLPTRLVSTARLATSSSESFFAALPDGDTLPAMRFAVLVELLAVLGLALFVAPLVLIAAPWVFHALANDAGLRGVVLRALGSGIPGVAFAMVAVHAAHGVGLDWGARRCGSSYRGRGLRFGLYACGWDLLTLPLALLVVAVVEGPRRAMANAALGLSVPGRAARAYLRGVHQLEERETEAACRFAVWIVAAVMTLAAAGVALATLLL